MPLPQHQLQQPQPLTRRVQAWVHRHVVQLRLRHHHARIDADLRHHLDERDYYADLGVHAQWARDWHAKQADDLMQRASYVQALREQLRSGGTTAAVATSVTTTAL